MALSLMTRIVRRALLPLSFPIALLVGSLLVSSVAQADNLSAREERHAEGALFVMSNSADRVRGNEVVMYARSRGGDLALVGYFPTGDLALGKAQLGSGPAPTSTVFGVPVPATADALGSAQSLILGHNNRCLFAVNAGSNSVSALRVLRDGLRLVDVADSLGEFPVSLAKHGDTLYVLNSGGRGSLTGFRVHGDCRLTLLAGSTRDLGGITNSFLSPAPVEILTSPAQIAFTPDGKRLVLSVKGGPDGNPAPAGRMAVFPVAGAGLLHQPVVTPFSYTAQRAGPFSFMFTDHDTLIALHANSRTIAAYTINVDHTLSVLSGPFDTGTFAPCWLDASGRFVYVANFGEIPATGTSPDGNGVLVGFRLLRDGALQPTGLRVPYPTPAVGHGNHGIDIKVIGRFLYFLQPRTGQVGRLSIGEQGALTNLGSFGGLAPGVEPFTGANPGINAFFTRCFLQDANNPAYSPECRLGSAVGIAGF